MEFPIQEFGYPEQKIAKGYMVVVKIMKWFPL